MMTNFASSESPLPILDEARAIDKLIESGIITPKKIRTATFDQCTELAARSLQFLKISAETSHARATEKAKTVLNEYGDKYRIKLLTARAFMLTAMTCLRFPNLVEGLIFTGSQTRKDISPGPNSDLDIKIVGGQGNLSSYDFTEAQEFLRKFGSMIMGREIDLSGINGTPGIIYIDKLNQSTQKLNGLFPSINSDSLVLVPKTHIREVVGNVFGIKPDEKTNVLLGRFVYAG